MHWIENEQKLIQSEKTFHAKLLKFFLCFEQAETLDELKDSNEGKC